MKKCKGSINSIESMGLVDGPGIRTVVFFNGCRLRCKFCHNPEMWNLQSYNYEPIELVNKILRFKPYFKNNGGVTFSGGEPLLQSEFLIETMKLLKENNIHIALDTAGIGSDNYGEILKYTDLVLLDIKHVEPDGYKRITGTSNLDKFEKFVSFLNKSNTKVWIRQVIIPDENDNEEYLVKLKSYLKKINNIERIDFLPFHRLGREKYIKLGVNYSYENKNDMNKIKCMELYDKFMTL